MSRGHRVGAKASLPRRSTGRGRAREPYQGPRNHSWLPITVAALVGVTPVLAAPPANIDGGAAAPGVPVHIEELVREISPKNIEATVRKLVSFGTRHTLSDTTGDER